MLKLIDAIKNNPQILNNDLSVIKRKFQLLHLSDIKISKLIISLILNKNNKFQFKCSPIIMAGKLSVFFTRKLINENPFLYGWEIQEPLEFFGQIQLNNKLT